MNAGDVAFAAGALRARLLGPDEAPLLQAFFDANPTYFESVNGEPPAADEAAREFADLPPPELTFGSNWMIGAFAADGRLVAIAHGLGDFIAPGVWHIGLFVVATDLHGGGVAHATYGGLEDWIRRHGARWIRLGVVRGNVRGERFWARVGYREVRVREGLPMGQRVHDVRVLVKPLADAPLADYLALVARDRPGAP